MPTHDGFRKNATLRRRVTTYGCITVDNELYYLSLPKDSEVSVIIFNGELEVWFEDKPIRVLSQGRPEYSFDEICQVSRSMQEGI